MRFLLDESCDVAFAKALAVTGHDVTMVAQVSRGADDAVVIERAKREKRILLTEDKAFGRLVYLEGAGRLGVIFLRYKQASKGVMAERLARFVARRGAELHDCFVVMQANRVRSRRSL